MQYLICILQHRAPKYAVTSFLHLHAALMDRPCLASKCKIVLACSTHGSPLLASLQEVFGQKYDLEVVEAPATYLDKIRWVLERYQGENDSVFIKCDEDVFPNRSSWASLLSSAPGWLASNASLLATVNLSTGIPSWSRFAEAILTANESASLQRIMAAESVPQQLWDNDYSALTRFIDSQARWEEAGYWEEVNRLPYSFKGIHPIRTSLQCPWFMNEVLLQNYARFQNTPANSTYTPVRDRYLCNSFFAIGRGDYQRILSDPSLFVDAFDEVPVNRQRERSNAAFGFLDDSAGIHIAYNTVFSEIVKHHGVQTTGRELEEWWLDGYARSITRWLGSHGCGLVDRLRLDSHPLKRKVVRVFRQFGLLPYARAAWKRMQPALHRLRP